VFCLAPACWRLGTGHAVGFSGIARAGGKAGSGRPPLLESAPMPCRPFWGDVVQLVFCRLAGRFARGRPLPASLVECPRLGFSTSSTACGRAIGSSSAAASAIFWVAGRSHARGCWLRRHPSGQRPAPQLRGRAFRITVDSGPQPRPQLKRVVLRHARPNWPCCRCFTITGITVGLPDRAGRLLIEVTYSWPGIAFRLTGWRSASGITPWFRGSSWRLCGAA